MFRGAAPGRLPCAAPHWQALRAVAYPCITIHRVVNLCGARPGCLRGGSRGFAHCLSYQAAPLLLARRLRIVLADYEVEPWPVHVTYPSARLLPSRTRVFVEWITRALQESAQAFGAREASHR